MKTAEGGFQKHPTSSASTRSPAHPSKYIVFFFSLAYFLVLRWKGLFFGIFVTHFFFLIQDITVTSLGFHNKWRDKHVAENNTIKIKGNVLKEVLFFFFILFFFSKRTSILLAVMCSPYFL